jgi:hypothetical protein
MPLYAGPTPALASLAAPITIPITTETVVITAAVPANSVAVGQAFRINVAAVTSAANACTFRLRVGATGAVTDTQAWISKSLTAGAGDRLWFQGAAVVRTLGASGTIYADGRSFAVGTWVTGTVVAPATQIINTTSPFFVTLTLSATVGTTAIQIATIEAV